MSKLILLFLISFQIFFVIKNDCIGQQSITWQRVYGGPWTFFRDICQSDDGYFYVVGESNYQNIIIKLNDYGDTIWTKTLYGFTLRVVAPVSGGGCIFSGESDSTFISRIDSSGQILWVKKYSFGRVEDIERTSDGGYIVCGWSDFIGGALKVDSMGNAQWYKFYPIGFSSGLYSVTEAYDNGYLLTGGMLPNTIDTPKVRILKIKNNGETDWTKIYKFGDASYSISIEKVNNSYLIGGGVKYYDWSTTDTNKILFFRIDLEGNMLYSKIFDFDYSQKDFLNDLKPINSNKYVFAALRDSDMVIPPVWKAMPIITDSLGNILHINYFTHGDEDEFRTVIPLNNGDLVFAGYVDFPNGAKDGYVVRTDSTLYAPEIIGIRKINESIPTEFKLYQNYPNPFNSSTKIRFDLNINKRAVKLIIYDILGREAEVLINQNLDAGFYEIRWNANKFSSGVYYYKLQAGDKYASFPMILIK